MNSERSGRARSTSIQWICGGQAESASNKPLSDIVSKNKLALFSIPQANQRSRSKEQVASLKTNCTLFSRFYIACQARQCNLDDFFEHEKQACPPSISDMGQLRQGSKSDLMGCLTKSSQPAIQYSSWNKCQGLGRGCNCAYRSGPELVDIWGVYPGNDSSVNQLLAWNC